MQADRFTIKSQEAVAGAQRLATASRTPEISPTHLLAALLDQEDGLVVPMLQSLEVDVPGLRERVAAKIDELPTLSGDAEPEVRPSSLLTKVLQRAEKEMAGLSDEYISVEHLLLALASSDSGIAGVLPDHDALVKAISEIRGPTGSRRRTPRTPSRRSRSTGAT